MPRVTRAQAEAALNRLFNDSANDRDRGERVALGEATGSTHDDFSTLRAYLAQRPDEETIRKGHEAVTWLETLGVAMAQGSPMVQEVFDNATEARAAMYQPEEEA